MQHKLTLTCMIAITGLLLAIPSVLADNANSLAITNLSNNTINLTLEQLQAMPKAIVNANLYCESNLVASGDWGGIPLGYLLTKANATTDVCSISFKASDGYTVTLPIYIAINSDTIIAYEKDGQSLNEGLRLILPGFNGAAWIAMITNITMSSSEALPPEGVSTGANSIPSLIQSITLQNHTQTPASSPSLTPTNNPTLQPTDQTSTNQFQLAPTTQNSQETTSTPIWIYASVAGAVSCTIAILMLNIRKRKPMASVSRLRARFRLPSRSKNNFSNKD